MGHLFFLKNCLFLQKIQEPIHKDACSADFAFPLFNPLDAKWQKEVANEYSHINLKF
jgi:hypothetical protein